MVSALLLFPPPASATTALPTTVEVDAIAWSGGLSVEGSLQAVHAQATSSVAPMQGQGSWNNGSLEIDYVDFMTLPGVVGIGTASGTSPAQAIAGPFELSPTGEDSEALFYPVEERSQLVYWALEGRLSMPSSAQVSFRHTPEAVLPTEEGFPVPGSDVTEALELRGSVGSLTLDGPHGIVLWEYDLVVANQTYWSGERQQSETESRQQVIRAMVESLPAGYSLDDPSAVSIYVAEPRLVGDGLLRMERPRSPEGELLGSVLEVEGDYSLQVLEQSGAGILVRFIDVGTARLDGSTVTVGQVESGVEWMWAVGMGGLVVAAGATLGIARRSPSMRLQAMEKHMARRHYGWVASHAGPAMRSPKTARKASVLKATSLLAMQDFKEARLFLAALGTERRPDPATFHFLSAHAAAGMGQDGPAASELAACLELEPSYAREAEAIEPLRRTLRQIMPEAFRDSGESYT